MNARSTLLALPLALSIMVVPPSAFGGRIPDVVEDAMAYAITDRSKAISLLEQELQANPEGKSHLLIRVHAGEQRRLNGDMDESHQWFASVLARTDKGTEAGMASLGLALLQAGDGTSTKTLGLMTDLSEKTALGTQNADRYLILAADAHRRNEPAVRSQYAKQAIQAASEDPAVLERVRTAVESFKSGGSGQPVTMLPTVALAGGDLERADQALAEGKKDQARQIALQLQGDSAEGSPERQAADYLLARIEAAPVKTNTVAVLLPLEGKYGAVGQRVQAALEYGHAQAGGRFDLQYIDSGSTSETAVAGLEKAALEYGAIAVVGPLLSDETDAVVAAAEAMRIPLISLSQSLEPTEDSAFVYQSMVSTGDQIVALLDQVMTTGGMDAFAVFSPQNSYGERATELFTAAVTERGGQVTVTEFYDPTATDLIPFAKTLGRKDYEGRAREFYELRKTTEEKGGNPSRVVLPPVIDFDAIFIPDNASRVPLAAAALAFEEFPMGDFQPTKDSPFIPLLGLSGWNNATLVGTGGPYARRSYFTDAFLLPANVDLPPWQPTEDIQTFIEDYKEQTGRTPTALEAITVDAGMALGALSQAQLESRMNFRDTLGTITIEQSVTGLTGFDAESHRATRDLMILSISEDAIVPHTELPQDEYGN